MVLVVASAASGLVILCLAFYGGLSQSTRKRLVRRISYMMQ